MNKKDFAIMPFNSTKLKDRYLVSTCLGSWDFLDKDEFGRLRSFNISKESPLFKRLHEKGVIADENNINNLVNDYRSLNANLFYDTSLHIAVITTRCNLGCTYCQTKL